MAKVIRYYEIDRHGKGRWRPKGSARALGFRDVPCGVDGPVAWAIAEDWNRRLDDARSGRALPPIATEDMNEIDREEATIYPAGSVGEAFRRFRTTEVWRNKKARTREDWFRAWRHLKPFIGNVDPRTIDLEVISWVRAEIAKMQSVRETHRVIKIWRALWKAMVALRYCTGEDPSLAFQNEAAPGRTQTWTEAEVRQMVAHAWRTDRKGLACIMAVSWDAMLSPVDARSVEERHIAKVGRYGVLSISRRKTGAGAAAQLRPIVMRMIAAYTRSMPKTVGPMFRTATDKVPFRKNSLSQAFREVRTEVFGKREKRMLLDMRRSGAVEALEGGAAPAALSRAMGNTLAASNALFETYVPPTNPQAKAVADARTKARSAAAAEQKVIRIPNRRT